MTIPFIKIASTRVLHPTTKEWAMQQNIVVADIDFLEITLEPNTLETCIIDAPLVFTSAHAVAAFVQQYGKAAGKKCYAISGNTKNKAQQAGFVLVGDAKDGATLAEVILSGKEKKVIHLCGNIRREELRNTLTEKGLTVVEIEVYRKTPSPQKIEEFDAVMFFSPSQVDAFLQANELPEATPAFCVGNTTANHLKSIGHKNYINANTPNEQAVMRAVINYYKFNR